MKKTLTLYYCDVKEKNWNLLQLMEHISKEFSGSKYPTRELLEQITPTLGISITLEAEMPDPEEIVLSA